MWKHPYSEISNSGFEPKAVRSWITRQAASLKSADLCFVSTRWAARSLMEDYGVAQSKVHVVGMGHRPRTESQDRNWSIPRVLYVGLDWKRKNGDAVVKAFQQLRDVCPAATLDVVGRHPPIDTPGIRTHGFLRKDDPQAQQTLDRIYSQATIFLLPSLFDPSPIAYLEAGSAGLPVVGTTEGGAAELLQEGALVVDPTNPDDIANALLKLADPAVARQMGEVARRRAAQSTWLRVAERILDGVGDLLPRSTALQH
jgi:glycosyltransferase involved in cell wall biosynthesis